MFEWQEQYHEWAQRTSEISFLLRERRIRILELTCNVLYHIKILMTVFLCFSEDFWPLSEDFRKFSKIVPKARRTFPNIFREFRKFSEDCRRLSRKTRRCFDDTLTKKIIDTFTSEDIVSFLSTCCHSVYHWPLYSSCNNGLRDRRRFRQNEVTDTKSIHVIQNENLAVIVFTQLQNNAVRDVLKC